MAAQSARLEAWSSTLRRNRFELTLLVPLVLYFGVVVGYFIIRNVILSFETPAGGDFPTLATYQDVLSGFRFRDAVRNTFLITAVSVTLEMLLGLAFALLAAQRFRGVGLFRALLILPLAIPGIVAATNMRFIFSRSGYANRVLGDLSEPLVALGVLDGRWGGIDWLGGPVAVLTVALADMWKVTPLVAIILLAGLQSIPEDVYEAASIDGASAAQRLRFITLPLLRPAILAALVIRGIDAFRIFIQPLALGVSGHVPVLSSEVFREFQAGNRPAAAANSVILMVIILSAVAVAIRLGRAPLVGKR